VKDLAPKEWIENAYRRLDDARFLCADGRARTATSQVYYALYYACRALLEKKEFYFQRHTSVTSNVGRVERYRRHLNTSFPTVMQYRREQCDYELFTPNPDEVSTWIEEASRFISRAEQLLEAS
jgi:uncharacterized protein (UPF0332 family)